MFHMYMYKISHAINVHVDHQHSNTKPHIQSERLSKLSSGFPAKKRTTKQLHQWIATSATKYTCNKIFLAGKRRIIFNAFHNNSLLGIYKVKVAKAQLNSCNLCVKERQITTRGDKFITPW